MRANQGCAQIFEKKTLFKYFFWDGTNYSYSFFENRNFVIMRIARKKNLFLYALFKITISEVKKEFSIKSVYCTYVRTNRRC